MNASENSIDSHVSRKPKESGLDYLQRMGEQKKTYGLLGCLVGCVKNIYEDNGKGGIAGVDSGQEEVCCYFPEKITVSEGDKVAYRKGTYNILAVLEFARPYEPKQTVTFADVGGLDCQIDELKTALMYFDEDMRKKMEDIKSKPPRGVLLYGPPGTGKTLLAKACANYVDRPFYSVSAPQILDKFLSESPKNIKRLFDQARKEAPSIVYIDEISAFAGHRDYQTRDGGVRGEVSRTVDELLNQMDGMNGNGYVLVLASTNKPLDIDDALWNRFNKKLSIPTPNEEAKRQIIEIKLKGVKTEGKIDAGEVARILHAQMQDASGRSIEDILEAAKMISLKRDEAFSFEHVKESIDSYVTQSKRG